MPKYVYECSSCEEVFEVRHSIKERLEDCSLCEEGKTLTRIPSAPLIIKNKPMDNGSKAGSVVKEFIEDARREISSEKRELREREYKI
jgi:putative FmdB family regulatory protein|tara:strand:- start:1456 stop:1719 length:264 start_codon:yes stop_codon:yes gene_type:complete